ncbi:MAG: phage holin family protein [Candidatus Kapabacteria bacterium]|nr:phage holin family protein [Candidatus Kapabacteria bacterium]MCS7169481.1 phage holin family protein [Candidatus Kapabacteria bacterium]MDW7996048.1 phage holin family protein [Bacteroidota bacterium]MDW8224553.1 phage holin family protein [Bacteroidota bacterium]
MLRFLVLWLLNAGIVYLAAHILPGITVNSFWTALIVSLALGLVNILVRPLLIVLTLPAVILTFGLFLLVINAVGIWLVSSVIPGFQIASFWDALLASVLISALSTFGRWLLHV